MNIVRPDHPPFSEIARDFRDILRSGSVTNNGKFVQDFEQALTWHFDAPTIVFNNGQSALMAMLAALDVRGREVIVPSFTFCATPHAVRWAGGEPVFADIDPTTLCIDPLHVSSLQRNSTAAVLAVDPYGIQCDVAPLSITGLPVLIDSAPSFGSYPDRTRGDAQIFSFHATKPFSTMEGGALVTRDLDLLERAKMIRNFGQDGGGDCEMPGINGKMMEVSALIGLIQLKTWHDRSMKRKSHAADFGVALMGIPGVDVISTMSRQAPIWLYRPILINEDEFGMSRDAVVAELAKREIYARVYYRPCHLLSCYRQADYRLPVTEKISSQVIALPVYNDFKRSEIDHITQSLRAIQAGARKC